MRSHAAIELLQLLGQLTTFELLQLMGAAHNPANCCNFGGSSQPNTQSGNPRPRALTILGDLLGVYISNN